MKVLVPLDGSRLADGMLAHARRVLLKEASSIHLLHVLPEYVSTEELDTARSVAQKHLDACRELLESTGETVTTSVVLGHSAERILETLESGEFDLCAMATHGRSGISRAMRGSVAERVLRHSPVPVLLANPEGLVVETDEVRFKRILVPLDGSPLSREILFLMATFAVDSAAEVVLMHVDQPGQGTHPVAEVAERQAQQRAEKILDELRCELEESGVPKTIVVGRYGDPADMILEEIEALKPDLVAMSSHGRTGVSRFRFGSVAEKVLRLCSCPLLVKPSKK
jgi:nucleotide-binding universal stress UspA family protein